MNIIAMSTAQEVMTVGTVLYVDDLYLDYTVNVNPKDPASGITIYNDKETSRLMTFYDFPEVQTIHARLINMRGQTVLSIPAEKLVKGRQVLSYGQLTSGIYILQVIHDGMVMNQKILLTHINM